MPKDPGQRIQPRPLWQIVLIGFLVGGWLLIALLFWQLRFGRSALPIEVSIRVDGPSGEDGVKLGWEFRRGGFRSPEGAVSADREQRTWFWEIREAWVRSLLLAGEPAALAEVETITVRVGNHLQVFPRDTWPAAWKSPADALSLSVPARWEVRTLGTGPAETRSILGPFAHVMNYPGDAVILGRALRHSAFLGFLGLWLLVLVAYGLLRRRPVRRSSWGVLIATRLDEIGYGGAQRARATWTSRAAWWLGGLALLAACLSYLEAPARYHFTQDDNYRQFLPGMLYGCRCASAGGFPDWNPYQLLGAPLAEVGTYALTYPPTYLSHVLAKHLLGNEYATLEVFCVLHVIGGYCAFLWFGHRLGLSPAVGSAAGLCFVLSGYALVAGAIWYYMTPTFLWAPLLGVSVLGIARGNAGWRWVVGTAAAIGLYFHAGNVQMWTYAMAFFGIALLWACLSGPHPRPRLVRAVAAVAGGLGLAAPLLVAQFLGVRGIDRAGAGGWDALDGLHAILAPFPLGKTVSGADSRYGECFRQVYYAGSVFTLAWSSGLVVAWVYPRRLGGLLRSPLFTLGLVALLLCVGDPGVLWYAQAKLPILNKFSHPVKLLPFFHFFSLAAGAVVVHRLTSGSRSAAKWQALCFVVVAVLLLYHVVLVRTAAPSFTDRPYPAMPDALDRLLRRGPEPVRVIPVQSVRSLAVNFPLGLADNYGTVYGIDCFSGLDPLVSSRPEHQQVERRAAANLLDTLRRYGVTHLVLHATGDSSRFSEFPGIYCYQKVKHLYRREPLRSYCANRESSYEDREIRVFLLDETEPIAFSCDDRTRPLPVFRTASGLTVDAAGLPGGGRVVINYLWHRAIRVFADGHRIPAWADDFGRIATTVPPGTRTLTVRYQSPWLAGLALGATLTAMGAAIAWLAGQDRPPQRDAS